MIHDMLTVNKYHKIIGLLKTCEWRAMVMIIKENAVLYIKIYYLIIQSKHPF